MTSFTDLITPLTPDQVRQSIYDVLAALGVKTAGWKPGAVVRTIITAVAIVFAGFTELTSQIARAGFLELSSGDWLTQVTQYGYGTTRIEATFATTDVKLTNAAGGDHNFGIGEVIFVNSGTGKTYRNTEAIALPPYGTDTVEVQAIEAGTDSNAAAGQIDDLETTLTGVTVTNLTAAIANDRETDEALKARAKLQATSISPNGPWEAYVYVALSATRSDGTSVGITRVATSKDATDGTVTVTLANATGAVPSADVDVVNELLQTKATPVCVTLTTQSADPAVLPVTYQVWAYRSGLSETELTDAIHDSLEDFVATIPIGGFVKDGETQGWVYKDAVASAIQNARPVGEIWLVEVISPGNDVLTFEDEVYSLGTVTPSVNWVQRG